ncbi:BlaI/MecI/CopY family transcriptional regulator, partial [Candidatus Woesearchaeota archaeon]|nr:BlaI/MecI/CopY family transcriptional regulator [Candidatus Woesearchaeota archaeon]
RLIENCGYACQTIKPHKPSNTFYLNLSNKSIELFYRDYINLIKQFPFCNLANKHKSLVYIISRRKNKSNILDIDKAILNLLKKDKLKSMQIARILGLANCTILYHLANLHKKGMVTRVRKKRSFIWFASKNEEKDKK